MNSGRGGAALSQLVMLLGFVAHLGLGLVLTVLLGRALSPESFGFFAFVAALYAFARETTDLGTTSTAARDMQRDPGMERPLLEGLYAWRRLVGGVLAIGVFILAALQEDSDQRWILVATGLSFIAMGPPAFQAVFLARQAQIGPTLLGFITQIGLIIACVALLAGEFTGSEFAAMVVLREVVMLVGMALLGIFLVRYRLRPGLRGRGLGTFFAAAGIWGLAAACRHLYGQMDVLAVYLFSSQAELGALAAAYRPIAPAFLLPWVATAPLVPVLASMLSRRVSDYQQLVRQTLTIATSVGALGTVLGVVLAPDLVQLLYGGRYQADPMDAVTAMRWLALAILPVHLMAVAAVSLLAAGRERAVLVIIAAGLAVKIVANLIVVPIFGFLGAVATTAVMEVMVVIGLLWALFGRTGLRPVRLSAGWSLAPAVVVALLGPLVTVDPIWRLASLVVVGGGAFILVMRSPIGRTYLGSLREIRM